MHSKESLELMCPDSASCFQIFPRDCPPLSKSLPAHPIRFGEYDLFLCHPASIYSFGVLTTDFITGLIDPIILSPLGSNIACIMLGCDQHHVRFTYEYLEEPKKQTGLHYPLHEAYDGPPALEEFNWMSEFCTNEIPTRSILLISTLGYFNQQDHMFVWHAHP